MRRTYDIQITSTEQWCLLISVCKKSKLDNQMYFWTAAYEHNPSCLQAVAVPQTIISSYSCTIWINRDFRWRGRADLVYFSMGTADVLKVDYILNIVALLLAYTWGYSLTKTRLFVCVHHIIGIAFAQTVPFVSLPSWHCITTALFQPQ